MPLVAAVIEAKLTQEIYMNLKAAFAADAATAKGYPPEADEKHRKMAEAIAKGVAKVIVSELQTNAQVAPGIPIAGSGGGVVGPVSGVTTSPGKIL